MGVGWNFCVPQVDLVKKGAFGIGVFPWLRGPVSEPSQKVEEILPINFVHEFLPARSDELVHGKAIGLDRFPTLSLGLKVPEINGNCIGNRQPGDLGSSVDAPPNILASRAFFWSSALNTFFPAGSDFRFPAWVNRR
jgi:hypothetical protein